MTDRADVLVHGATGSTGRLVCALLRQRGVRFDVSGRDRQKLEVLARALGNAGLSVVDVTSSASLQAAVAGRRVVAACAGPFSEVGEPLLAAAAAEAGLVYVDIAGEQSFVARALRYHAEAMRAGACVVPSMAYEVAVADWLAGVATRRLGGAVERIAVCYAHGAGFARSVSRGTLLSTLGELGRPDAIQFVDGTGRREPPLRHGRRFAVMDSSEARREVVALSIPGPEALLMPSHTDARTVRTYATLTSSDRGLAALGAAATRLPNLVPKIARAARAAVLHAGSRAPRGDDSTSAKLRFEVIVEASLGGVSALARARGTDPYRITAEIQAFAITEALAGRVAATGVVAPSVAFDGARGLAMLEACGVRLEVTDRSREK